MIIPRYTLDTDICPYVCLEDYIDRTKSLRHDDMLLISTNRAIGSQTLAHWIKTVLQLAGVDIDKLYLNPIPLSMQLQLQVAKLLSLSMKFFKRQVGAMLTLSNDSVKAGFHWRRSRSRSRNCLLYTSPSPRDLSTSRMPSSA